MDALLRSGYDPELCGFADDDLALHDRLVLGRPVWGSVGFVVRTGVQFHVAIGDNYTREVVYQRLFAVGAQPFFVGHPTACISPFASLEMACFIAAGVIVAPSATIGAGVIVNHGAVVDHDSVVGDFAHVAPGATLAGGVRVGRGALVGAGANVLPGVSIGDYAIVGAGAVVTTDVQAGAVVVGVPAQVNRNVQS
jgi:sugar O-acyltransferase (sialic acid O-acetyltransferase NeuD family)